MTRARLLSEKTTISPPGKLIPPVLKPLWTVIDAYSKGSCARSLEGSDKIRMHTNIISPCCIVSTIINHPCKIIFYSIIYDIIIYFKFKQNLFNLPKIIIHVFEYRRDKSIFKQDIWDTIELADFSSKTKRVMWVYRKEEKKNDYKPLPMGVIVHRAS